MTLVDQRPEQRSYNKNYMYAEVGGCRHPDNDHEPMIVEPYS